MKSLFKFTVSIIIIMMFINIAFISNAEVKLINLDNPKLEKAVRLIIKKPKGELYQSDLDKISDFTFYQMESLKGVRYLKNLKSAEITESSLSNLNELGMLKELKELYIGPGSVNDISSLKNLEVLSIGYGELENTDSVKGLNKLREVTLNRYANSNADASLFISKLSGIKSLKKLRTVECMINNPSAFKNFSNLETLDLNFCCDLKGKKIEALSNMKKLKSLNLDDCSVTSINVVANLSNLEELYIRNVKVSSDTLKLEPLRALKKLRSLHLIGLNITDIKPINNLNSLERINLSDNKITDISHLSNFKKLTWLDLDNNKIKDLNPLVLNMKNGGFKNKGFISLAGNLLDMKKGSKNLKDIEYLKSKGITVNLSDVAN